MKKIENFWDKVDGFKCFGCSKHNDHGLHMEFWEDGDKVVSHWKPETFYEGWIGIIHGGIQATLCDEIAGWTVISKLNAKAVTAKMEIKYIRPVESSEKELVLESRIVKHHNKLVVIEVDLLNSKNQKCAEATCTYFITPEEGNSTTTPS